jgi:hypothetical protein
MFTVDAVSYHRWLYSAWALHHFKGFAGVADAFTKALAHPWIQRLCTLVSLDSAQGGVSDAEE